MANFLNSWSIISSSGFQATRGPTSKAETLSIEKAAKQGRHAPKIALMGFRMACM
jgi:hypothetical protein